MKNCQVPGNQKLISFVSSLMFYTTALTGMVTKVHDEGLTKSFVGSTHVYKSGRQNLALEQTLASLAAVLSEAASANLGTDPSRDHPLCKSNRF